VLNINTVLTPYVLILALYNAGNMCIAAYILARVRWFILFNCTN
jgi:hypothetical protein